VSKKAYVIVRVNTGVLPVVNLRHQRFPLLKNVQTIKKAGAVRSWRVLIPSRDDRYVQGRVCVIRKSNEAIKLAEEKLKRNAQRKGHVLKPETLEYAKYVILFTNYPEDAFSAIQILDWYRSRWQVELVFKRFKSIAELGHLPKHSDDSSKAWLYGKLFVALLTNKLVEYASSVSPWGYILEEYATSECLA
jgi:IS4 transposase